MTSWKRDMRMAIARNMRDPELLALVVDARDDVPMLVSATELHVRRVLPYAFGAAQRILALRSARRRGYGACGDGTAALAAVCALAGVPTSALCYEREETLRGYAHVRILVGDVVGDAFRDRRVEVDRCSAVIDLDRLMGARWRRDAAARGARARRQAGGSRT